MTTDDAAADREELELEEEEVSPEESLLKGLLPEPEPTENPSLAP